MRVLLVEDDVVVGMSIAMLVEEWGHVPDGPHVSSADAVKAIAADPPDVAILDVDLRGGDTCLPVAEELKARQTPFFILSGLTSPDYEERAELRGMKRVRKPVSEEELYAALESIRPIVDRSA